MLDKPKPFDNEKLSLGRPAWTTNNLLSFRDKVVNKKTLKDYYVKSRGRK